MGGFVTVFLTLGVIKTIDNAEPVIWGTFTEEYCHETRQGCSSIGTWESFDGTIRKTDIRLDGAVEPGGSVRAGYRPTGIMNDEDNNIVHTPGWIDASPTVSFLAAAGIAGYGLFKALEWEHLKVPALRFPPGRRSD